MPKNKGHQKGAVKHKLEEVKDQWKDHRDRIAKMIENFQKKVITQMAEFGANLANTRTALSQQILNLDQNVNLHADVLDSMDAKSMAMAKMLKDVYGRIEQLDQILERSDVDFSHDFSDAELEEVKKNRDETYNLVMKEAFKAVHEERQAIMEQRRKEAEEAKKKEEEAQKAKEEAEKKESEAEEAKTAEAVLQEAETAPTVGEAGGQGSDIPEGAEVFGG